VADVRYETLVASSGYCKKMQKIGGLCRELVRWDRSRERGSEPLPLRQGDEGRQNPIFMSPENTN
jgi:hypothetical protein